MEKRSNPSDIFLSTNPLPDTKTQLDSRTDSH
jgi:hypothetical protein